MRGRVYIVGAGPGDPELITLKALKILQQADAVLYDRLVSQQLLEYARGDALKIYVGKSPGEEHRQNEINRMLVELAGKGMTVVRLKNGDPMVFGRGAEECMYVSQHGIPCEIVPGVSSFLAAAATSCTPLTMRGHSSSFAVVTASEDPAKKSRQVDLSRVAQAVDVVVVLMGARRAREVLKELADTLGGDAHGVVVVSATLPEQKIFRGTLAELIELASTGAIQNPAVIIVGRTAGLGGGICME
ncbi:MAG: uroporphyrinogen-III C-methyltransferase [Ignisphaera sp.]|nr:uroporphyrinogen-III C-methyltransferase [Ignisphaera sp.]MDW8086154.1 uroporphyrinogen-III C-methyltransferase [Ignisphaera sp.]